MKMLPTFAPYTTITENGHYLVRPTEDNTYEVVDAVTDEVHTVLNEVTGERVPAQYTTKSNAEAVAVFLAESAIDQAQPVE